MRRVGVAAVTAGLLAGLLLACGSDVPSPTVTPRHSEVAFRINSDLAALTGHPWTATPMSLSPDTVAVIDAFARARDSTLTSDFELALVDARGDSMLSAFFVTAGGAGRWWYGTSVTPDGELEDALFGSSAEPGALVTPGPRDIVIVDHSHVEVPLDASFVFGIAGADITRVEIDRVGAPPVVASLSDGWYAAWTWGRFGLTIRGFDASGAEVVEREA